MKDRTMRYNIICLFCIPFFISCFSENGKKDSDNSDIPKSQDVKIENSQSGIILSLPKNIKKDTVSIKILGIETPIISEMAPNDVNDMGFALKNLPIGKYDILVKATKNDSTSAAIFLQEISIPTEEFINYTISEMPVSSSLKGNLNVLGEKNAKGIKVYLEGILLETSTHDSSGSFILNDIPKGKYTISFSRDDLFSGKFSEIEFSGLPVNLGPVYLKKNSDFVGNITIHSVIKTPEEEKYKASILISNLNNASYFKIANLEQNLENQDAFPFKSSIEHIIDHRVSKEIYIQVFNSSNEIILKSTKSVSIQ